MTQSENPVVKFLRGKHDEYGLFCRLLLSALNQESGSGDAEQETGGTGCGISEADLIRWGIPPQVSRPTRLS